MTSQTHTADNRIFWKIGIGDREEIFSSFLLRVPLLASIRNFNFA